MRLLRQPWVIALVALAVGFGAGVFAPFQIDERNGGWEVYEKGSYEFISPLLSCGEGSFNHLGNDETVVLEEQLQTLVAGMKAQQQISDAGIYFRELNGGPWVGVNHDAQFSPGSLLKVPLAISVYQLSESDPGLLSREAAYEGEAVTAEQYFKDETLLANEPYTVEELVRRAIVYSDNTAAVLLAEVIGLDEVKESYERLGVSVPAAGQDYSTSVRTYASFFRILYNATYLDRINSEKLLSHLAESKFNDGLVAGLPAGTKVAHKFGERSLAGEDSVQLHDCGIVYHPKQPYLLCIMMRGTSFDALASSIASISRFVYESID